jgi:hypothetical protein
VLKSSATIVLPVPGTCQARAWHQLRALWFIVLVAGVQSPVHAQTKAGPDVFADIGLADGRGAASDVAWIAGATVASAPLTLGDHWDFSVTAHVGREPVVAMARGDEGVVPAYVDAWRLSASIGFARTSHAFDVDVIGRFAETRVDTSQPVMLARNDNGPWTFLFDASANIRGYLPRDRGRPEAQRRLAPLVQAFAGVRHDRRFHRGGDLQSYDDPTGRLFGGVVVGTWRWRRADGAPRCVVEAGADFETALRAGTRLPSTGRIFVLAAVDVRRMAAQ